MKLTQAQLRFLHSIVTSPKGYITPPYGYRQAGGDAARWHRTAEVLQKQGLVHLVRLRNANGYLARLVLPAPAFLYDRS